MQLAPFLSPPMAPHWRHAAPTLPRSSNLCARHLLPLQPGPCKRIRAVDPTIPFFSEDRVIFSLSLETWKVIGGGVLQVMLTLWMAQLTLKALDKLRIWGRKAWRETDHVSNTKKWLLLVLLSSSGPLHVLLPLVAIFFSVQSLVQRLDLLQEICGRRTGLAAYGDLLDRTLEIMQKIDDLFLNFVGAAGTIFVAWFAIALKDEYVSWLLANREEGDIPSQELRRIVIPLSSLGTWVMVGAAIMTWLSIKRFDAKPLLTLTGMGGVLIAFGLQPVMVNMISGINLFLTRPFVSGDHIEAHNKLGQPVLKGTVMHVNPLRTSLSTDENYAVEIPNTVLVDLIISNESRGVSVAPRMSGARMAIISAMIGTSHLESVGQISSTISEAVKKVAGAAENSKNCVSVSGITENYIVMEIKICARPRIDSFNNFRIRVAIAAKHALAKSGIENAKMVF